jgi:predicted methyltransferase
MFEDLLEMCLVISGLINRYNEYELDEDGKHTYR